MIGFRKAHACGNDFLVVDAALVEADGRGDFAMRLCSRTTGLGADGVEFLEWTGERSGRIHLRNADGSVAEISGNGTRCVAAWMAWEKEATAGDVFAIETDAGLRECRIVSVEGQRFEIATGMGGPQIERRFSTVVHGVTVEGAVISMGNPHVAVFVESGDFSVGHVPWTAVGREICFSPDFPEQTNVEFVRMTGDGEIEIRIFERGVGPTSSSGTGSCAAATAAIGLRGAKADLRVVAPGGAQRVSWLGEAKEMILTGPAELIAFGEVFAG